MLGRWGFWLVPKRYDIWGPSTGSSFIRVSRHEVSHRVTMRCTTDFGDATIVLHDEAVRKLRDALNELLGE